MGAIEFKFDTETNSTDILQSLKTLKSDPVTVNMIRNFFASANQTQMCLLNVRNVFLNESGINFLLLNFI